MRGPVELRLMGIATDRFYLSRKRERYEEFARADRLKFTRFWQDSG
jgi:hypothetical protein